MTVNREITELQEIFAAQPHIHREHTPADVVRLRQSLQEEHTLSKMLSSELRVWLATQDYVPALGVQDAPQAVQYVRASQLLNRKAALYGSGWTMAAANNTAQQVLPDMGLAPSTTPAAFVSEIYNGLRNADRNDRIKGVSNPGWYAPMIVDGDCGYGTGSPLHVYHLTQSVIRAGAAGIHIEDQAELKKCGHMGGKVLCPTSQAILRLKAARLAADVLGVYDFVIVGRVDALDARFLVQDIDTCDQKYIKRTRRSGRKLGRSGVWNDDARTPEGWWVLKRHEQVEDGSGHTYGFQMAAERAITLGRYADMIWCETSTPDLEQARAYAEAVHAGRPGLLLAYNCSPSFNWSKHLNAADIAVFQAKLAGWGYKYQFITLAGWHANNYSFFDLSKKYLTRAMAGYVELQDEEFAAADAAGYTAVRHQEEVGAKQADTVLEIVSAGQASNAAMKGSTEEHQF